MKLLFIDDERFALKLLMHQFSGLGFRDVTPVTGGKAALALIGGGERFDVILTDLQMPVIDVLDTFGHTSHAELPGNIEAGIICARTAVTSHRAISSPGRCRWRRWPTGCPNGSSAVTNWRWSSHERGTPETDCSRRSDSRRELRPEASGEGVRQ